ncbi:MAG: hypothetical protein ACLQJR_28525 [Stellaceae bacterium]
MAKAKSRRGAGRAAFVPSEAQRAFVAAANAVGLPLPLICRMLPRGEKGAPATVGPADLERHFAEELSPGSMLATRLVVARVLQRALTGDDREAMSAQMAVFKTLEDWRTLGDAQAAEDRLAVDRLTREERDALRQLLDKAAEADPAD